MVISLGLAGLPKFPEIFRNPCFICVLGLIIVYTADAVFRKTTAEGVTGDSVLLPCFTNKSEHKLQDIEVTWRYDAKQNVYEIIKGKSSVKDQDHKYKNRIDAFPEEFVKGNFSLQLNSLTHSDAGEYHCFIKHSHEAVTVKLHIIESTGEKDKLLWLMVSIPIFGVLVLSVYVLNKWCFSVARSGISAPGGLHRTVGQTHTTTE